MRVGQRLLLAVVPAIVGLLAVAALAYWGAYARQAPEWVIVVAVVASIGSATMAWHNTRYVAHRVEQLAARVNGDRSEPPDVLAQVRAWRSSPRGSDELDRIEGRVRRIVEQAGHERAALLESQRGLQERLQRQSDLIAEVVEESTRRLHDARLPLHILLENHFGDLNDNQEEMLVAAREATDGVALSLRELSEAEAVDQAETPLLRTPVSVHAMVDACVRSAGAQARARGVSITADASAVTGVVQADRARLQDALQTLLSRMVSRMAAGTTLKVVATEAGDAVELAVSGLPGGQSPGLALARRVVGLHGGSIDEVGGRVVLRLPRTGFA